MKNVTCLIAVILVMAASQSFGYVEFKDGGTHNINYTINDTVEVDSQSPGMQTTVNLIADGLITYPARVHGYYDSRINISGGTMGAYLFAYDRCQVTISSGAVSNYLSADNNSKVTMTGGVVNIFYAHDCSQINWSGGSVKALFAYHSSQVSMTGGTTASLSASNDSRVIISGGTLSNHLLVDDRGKVIISGSNFAIDGTPVGFTEIKSILGGYHAKDRIRTLTGTLANGDIINTQFQIGNTASIVLIPEPCTLLLLGLGGFCIRRRFKV